jgi:transposase-like protein
MEDYPRTLIEFKDRFASDDTCFEYLSLLRWPAGFCCPKCGHAEAWQTNRGLFQCKKCRRQVSVTAGTIFHDSRKPLRLWFEAMWHITSQKYGANALGLQRILGLGSYHTAWKWLHRLRRAMVRPDRDKLYGTVEVDETYIGGERSGKRGRGAENKALVVVAVEDKSTPEEKDSKGIGRIRLKRVPDASSESLLGFIKEHVALGSSIRTDGWSGYEPLSTIGYEHMIVGPKELNIAHLVASLLKRWLLGTYQGAVKPRQLDYYLDEYTFRFNRRTSASRGKLFYRLVQQSVVTEPILGRDIIGGSSRTKHGSSGPHDAPS